MDALTAANPIPLHTSPSTAIIMGWLAFFGCALTAYGPILTLFLSTVAGNAQHVILALTAAFFWLIAILITSALHYAIPTKSLSPVTIAYAVLIQEGFRWGYYALYSRAEKGLNAVSQDPSSRLNRPMFAYVWALISYIALLVHTVGPGTMYTASCPSVSLSFISALETALISMLHVTWMPIAFDAFSIPSYPSSRMRLSFSKWWRILWVVCSHLAASYATLLNTYVGVSNGCAYAIMILVGLLGVSTGIAVHALMRRWR